MSPFHRHAKAFTEVPTSRETSSATKTSVDAVGASNHAEVNRAPPTNMSVHGQKKPDEKHHFWQHKEHHDYDRAQQVDYLKSRGYDEERARQAVENVELERDENRHRKKSLADKILGTLPAEDDPVSKGNLGQALIWRS